MKKFGMWHCNLYLLNLSEFFTVINAILLSRHHAEKVKATTEAVKKALSNCKTAQTAAEKAIMTAKADIMDTETRLAQVSCWQWNAGDFTLKWQVILQSQLSLEYLKFVFLCLSSLYM